MSLAYDYSPEATEPIYVETARDTRFCGVDCPPAPQKAYEDSKREILARGYGAEDTPVTQSVYTMVSPEQFREALDAAIEERQLTLREAITVRRARRNPRAFERLYGRVMQDVPVVIYAGPMGFDFQAFLDWLVENLPTILSLLLLFL